MCIRDRYYFPRKEEIYKRLMTSMLDVWLQPLREIDSVGDPIPELRSYIRRKLEMSRDFPRQSRLFANEMLQGAPPVLDVLAKMCIRDRLNTGWVRVLALSSSWPPIAFMIVCIRVSAHSFWNVHSICITYRTSVLF